MELFISRFEEMQAQEVLKVRQQKLAESGEDGSLFEDWLSWSESIAGTMSNDGD